MTGEDWFASIIKRYNKLPIIIENQKQQVKTTNF